MPTTCAATTASNPSSSARAPRVRPSVASRPARCAPTDKCIFSCACRTGTTVTVSSVSSAPTEPIRIATFVRSLKGSTIPRPTAAPIAPDETSARSGIEARITCSVRAGSREISRTTAEVKPSSAITTGM